MGRSSERGPKEPRRLTKILSCVVLVGLVLVGSLPEMETLARTKSPRTSPTPGASPGPQQAQQRATLSTQAQAAARITLDFETGDLRGWTASGNAFATQPTLGDNSRARGAQPAGQQGDFWVGTFENHPRGSREPGGVQGDRPQGTLVSTPFNVPRGTLSFLIGGGSAFETRVELRVLDPIEGAIRVAFASGNDTETMRRETWELQRWVGQQAQIRIIDESSGPWGHINVDDFRFSALQQRPEIGPINPGTEVLVPPGNVGPTRPAPLVAVPDVVGRDERAALEILEAGELEGRVAERRESERPPGTVVAQLPRPGNNVAPGSIVELVAAIPRTVRVPDLRGRPEERARRLLEAAELRAGTVTAEESRDPTGSVLAQSIPAGDIVELGAMIDFVVAAPMRATVPDLIELPEQEARRQVEVAELTVGTVAETESRRQPGIVVTQSERAGSRVPLGTRIDLLVSVPVMVVVPDLTERSEQEARGLLEGLELRLGNVASQEARQPVGSVLSQRPAAGSRVPIGTGVDLMVAEPVTVPVPDLVGQPEGRARQQLSDFELAVGSTSRRESRQQTGNVLAQSIEPGVRVVIGTSLDLVIAEPVRVTVPEVVGRSEADATAAITAVELTVGEVSYQESAALPGTVLTQSLNPGTQAQIGSAVNLLIAVIETVRVPEIVGNTVEEARRTLVTGRLAVGTEELRETRVEPEGTIMEQSRAAGTAVAVGTSINLVVAAPEIITVPSVIGLGEEEATAVILGAGLVVGVVGESLSVQAGGIVLEQGQEAGSQVVFGTPIALQVARDRTIWAVPAGFLLFVLVIGAVVARLSSKRSRRPRAPRDEPPADGTEVPEFEVRTVTDPGSQTMDTGSEPAAALEMRLRPHLDAGVQRIRASGELIAEEQREQRRSEDE